MMLQGEFMRQSQNDLIEQLFIAHREALYAYIRRRVGNEADAAELVQEAYVHLMQCKSAAGLHAAPAPYLFRTAINLLRDRHRRNTARAAEYHVRLEEALGDVVHDGPEALLARKEVAHLIDEAVGGLKPKAREVFALRLIDDMSYREIESRTRIPLRSIERYVKQARRYCASRIGRQL
jgi:RNA polymerase sigma-70 factor (ECF subfamily)